MMNIRRMSLALAFAFSFAIASPAWAQEVKAKPAQEAGDVGAGEELGIAIGVGYSLWVTDLNFESRTATEIVEYEMSSLSGVEIFGQMEVAEEMSLRLGGDFLLGVDITAIVGSLGVVYAPADLLEEPCELYFRAGILLGSIDMSGLPGDFKPSVGVEVGAGLTYRLDEYVEGLGFQIEAMARYLKFDFDKDETVLESDDEVGGFGVRFLAGLVYRF